MLFKLKKRCFDSNPTSHKEEKRTRKIVKKTTRKSSWSLAAYCALKKSRLRGAQDATHFKTPTKNADASARKESRHLIRSHMILPNIPFQFSVAHSVVDFSGISETCIPSSQKKFSNHQKMAKKRSASTSIVYHSESGIGNKSARLDIDYHLDPIYDDVYDDFQNETIYDEIASEMFFKPHVTNIQSQLSLESISSLELMQVSKICDECDTENIYAVHGDYFNVRRDSSIYDEVASDSESMDDVEPWSTIWKSGVGEKIETPSWNTAAFGSNILNPVFVPRCPQPCSMRWVHRESFMV